MIEKLEINGVKVDVDEDIKKYIHKKIGKLDRLMPRHARKSAHAKVVLSRSKGKKQEPTCEATIELPGKTLNAKESTINMYSSIDIVESKLARQLRKYKTTHDSRGDKTSVREFLGRLRNR
ncbi:MAG: ribosome-associated translation inhibitor RaiA [Patescibacteria group bacterium]